MDKLYYMAHPVEATDGITVDLNLEMAKCYLAALNRRGHYVIAPWVGLVEAMDERDAEDRLHGIRVDLVAVTRCDAVILVGRKVSPGMALEAETATEAGLPVFDMTKWEAKHVANAFACELVEHPEGSP